MRALISVAVAAALVGLLALRSPAPAPAAQPGPAPAVVRPPDPPPPAIEPPAPPRAPAPPPPENPALAARVAELEAENARLREEKANPIHQETESKLAKKIDARFSARPLLEILELLRLECGVEFLYDPSLRPRFEKMRIDLGLESAAARDVLDLIADFCQLKIEYLNGKVWIR